MSKYRQFIFKNYELNEAERSLKLYYSYDEDLDFCETYLFPFDFISYDAAALDLAAQLLFFMAGISYYKAYLASEIRIDRGQVDKRLAEFLSKTYKKGLGEFFYVNQLDPNMEIVFPQNCDNINPVLPRENKGLLIGIGGGKDSLVTAELLRHQPNAATWSLNFESQLSPLIERIGLPHVWVKRELDPQINTINDSGAYNGHVPISAIIACTGVIVAMLSGYQDVVVSNENSANEPTLHYRGADINHQYSKSLEFEKDFQGILGATFMDKVRYYSFLRPLSEMRIAELFSKIAFDKYLGVFSSCNRAYAHSETHMFWCGHCPKCAFVFLSLTPFIEQTKLEQVWGGKNLLLDPELEETYRQLLGIAGEKPLECVGEIAENRAMMRSAQNIYPQLKEKYQFELPETFDYKHLHPHSMPPEIYQILLTNL